MTETVHDLAIELKAVSRDFGKIRAIDGLDLEVFAGTVAVLIGPNGAGKTTTVRLITGALRAHSGEIRILGMDPVIEGDEARARCGVVPPKPAMFDQLSGLENLAFAADIFGVGHESIGPAAERFGIDHAMDQKVGGYSTGMRTRLALARAVIHDPDVLLLDEPTAGLDPESSRAVLDLIRELAGRGRTILMCTHLLHEAEGIADQVVLMGKGTALAAGAPEDLAARYVADAVVVIDAENRPALNVTSSHPQVVDAVWNGALHVKLSSFDSLPDVVTYLVNAGARLTRVEPQVPTLERLYFEMLRSVEVGE